MHRNGEKNAVAAARIAPPFAHTRENKSGGFGVVKVIAFARARVVRAQEIARARTNNQQPLTHIKPASDFRLVLCVNARRVYFIYACMHVYNIGGDAGVCASDCARPTKPGTHIIHRV